ncbi:hypothetical protein JPSP37_25390 [Staphylococcus pseudintermedius]
MANKTMRQKVYSEHQLKDTDLTYASMQQNLDKVVKDMIENGTPADQVLKMPFHYLLQILDERHTNKVISDSKADALFSAL